MDSESVFGKKTAPKPLQEIDAFLNEIQGKIFQYEASIRGYSPSIRNVYDSI